MRRASRKRCSTGRRSGRSCRCRSHRPRCRTLRRAPGCRFEAIAHELHADDVSTRKADAGHEAQHEGRPEPGRTESERQRCDRGNRCRDRIGCPPISPAGGTRKKRQARSVASEKNTTKSPDLRGVEGPLSGQLDDDGGNGARPAPSMAAPKKQSGGCRSAPQSSRRPARRCRSRARQASMQAPVWSARCRSPPQSL